MELHEGEYATLLERRIDEAQKELCDGDWDLGESFVRHVFARQRAFLGAGAGLLAQRVRDGRIFEGHGDLRPDHVWPGEPAAVIDCLEFSRRLRLLDPYDDLGFLALECERAGAPALGEALLAAYARASGDVVAPALVHFYQSCRATARARLAIRHLRDARVRGGPAVWRALTQRYLELADRHAGAALAGLHETTEAA